MEAKQPSEELVFQIAKLELGDGDILVVRVPKETAGTEVAETARMMQRIVPSGAKVVMMPDNTELVHLTRADLDERDAAFRQGAIAPK